MLVTTNKCHDHVKLLELYFATVSIIPLGLSALFPICNTRGRGNDFSGIQSLLQSSHQLNKLEEHQAQKGELLKLLHDPQKTAAPTLFPGRFPKIHPHNSAIRRKGVPQSYKK